MTHFLWIYAKTFIILIDDSSYSYDHYHYMINLCYRSGVLRSGPIFSENGDFSVGDGVYIQDSNFKPA